MSLFKKKEKLDFDEASGVILTFGLTLPDRAMLVKQDLSIDSNHITAVNTGYIIGISMLFIAPQIGLNKINEFIRSSMSYAIKNFVAKNVSNNSRYTKIC